MPTFFRLIIYNFIIFFFALNKEKKWESGHKLLKPSNCNGFSLPTFKIKTGKSPLFLTKSDHAFEISSKKVTKI